MLGPKYIATIAIKRQRGPNKDKNKRRPTGIAEPWLILPMTGALEPRMSNPYNFLINKGGRLPTSSKLDEVFNS